MNSHGRRGFWCRRWRRRRDVGLGCGGSAKRVAHADGRGVFDDVVALDEEAQYRGKIELRVRDAQIAIVDEQRRLVRQGEVRAGDALIGKTQWSSDALAVSDLKSSSAKSAPAPAPTDNASEGVSEMS